MHLTLAQLRAVTLGAQLIAWLETQPHLPLHR